MNGSQYPMLPPARYGLGAILSICAAVGSMVSSCSGRWILGLILAIIAIPLGLVGVAGSVSPRVRGGMLSIVAIVLGVIGVIVAIIAMIFRIVWFTF